MANGLYALGRQAFLDGYISWTGNQIKCVLVDTAAYTVNLATHQYLADVPGGARIATSTNFTGRTSTNGTADADDVTITGVSNTSIEAVVIYQDTGSAATSRLIAYLDTGSGIPFQTNNGDVTIVWDSGVNRIFTL